MKRYFLVFYVGRSNEYPGPISGNIAYSTNGEYVNMVNLSQTIKEASKTYDAVATNIIELKEQYYQTWIK